MTIKLKLIAVFVFMFLTTICMAETRYVANNGIDSNSCGSKASPCRSISQGIFNAGVNDLLRVGPGVYGDINDDGDFDDSGEESLFNEDGAVIKISKPIRIVSTHGARATFINANGAANFVFYLETGPTRIGKKRQGFTIKNANEANIFITGDRVRIMGNIISSSSSEAIGVLAGCFDDDDYGEPERGVLVNNSIIYNDGNGVELCSNTERFAIRKNDISNNGSRGMIAAGSDHRIIQNSLSGNETSGLTIDADNVRLIKNVVVANYGTGVSSGGENLVANSNSIIGNDGTGMFIFEFSELSKNNVFENFFDSIGGPYGNCGLFDNANTSIIEDTFYGASTGPGSDPADLYCSQIKSNVDNNFATSQHSIKVPDPQL